MPGLTSEKKKDRLSRISYRDYLLNIAKVDPAVIPVYQTATQGEWGVGIDAVSALDCWGFGLSGFQGLHLTARFGAPNGIHPGRLCRRRFLHLPLPGRERHHRSASGPQPDPGRSARARLPRCRHRQGRLPPARPAGPGSAHPPVQHRGAGAQPGRSSHLTRGRDRVCARGPDVQRSRRRTACLPAGT